MTPKALEERKEFYKMLLTPMSLEEKIDELGDLTDEDLSVLSQQFIEEENYEICQAIKVVRQLRKAGDNLA